MTQDARRGKDSISLLGAHCMQGPKVVTKGPRTRWRQKTWKEKLYHHHHDNQRYIMKECSIHNNGQQ